MRGSIGSRGAHVNRLRTTIAVGVDTVLLRSFTEDQDLINRTTPYVDGNVVSGKGAIADEVMATQWSDQIQQCDNIGESIGTGLDRLKINPKVSDARKPCSGFDQ